MVLLSSESRSIVCGVVVSGTQLPLILASISLIVTTAALTSGFDGCVFGCAVGSEKSCV